PCWRISRLTTRMAPMAYTCIRRGGCIRRPPNSASHAVITSSLAVVASCPACGPEPDSSGSPAAATEASSRKTCAATTARSWASAAAAKWSEHETRQAAHMHATFAQIIDAMGGRVHGKVESDGAKAIHPGGSIIHEVGGAIMGEAAASSVTNKWCQTWDVPNVFVTDGAPFPSNADKNPTLTIMANAWRVSDHILDRMRRKEI